MMGSCGPSGNVSIPDASEIGLYAGAGLPACRNLFVRDSILAQYRCRSRLNQMGEGNA